MSGATLFLAGLGVTLIVALASALPIYAAVLDGRDRKIHGGEIDAPPSGDPGWTFPPEPLRAPVP